MTNGVLGLIEVKIVALACDPHMQNDNVEKSQKSRQILVSQDEDLSLIASNLVNDSKPPLQWQGWLI